MLIYNAITMSEVLAMKEFSDAILLAGKNGLNNEVSWMHPLEIWDDPNEWIDGGELIFCCALGVGEPEDLIPFYRQLLKKGIVGFCLQTHQYMDTVPQIMLDLSEEYRCPLIAFKRPVRFIDLSRNLISNLIKHVNQDYLKEKHNLEENCWMLDWLNGDLTNERVYELLKMSPDKLKEFHYFTVMIEYSKSKFSYQWSEGIYLSVAKNLRILFERNQFFFYPFFANGILTGILLDSGKTDSWKSRFKNVVEEINKNLKNQVGKPTLILAAGGRFEHLEDIPKSYQTSQETMGICQRFQIDQYIYEDLNLYFILSLIGDANHLERMKEFIMEQIRPLLNENHPQNSKLMDTLKKYYACNGYKRLTAKELDITRHTLYYRLEQIEKRLDTDPMNVEKRLTMELSFAFYSYFLEMAK